MRLLIAVGMEFQFCKIGRFVGDGLHDTVNVLNTTEPYK